MVPLVQDHGVEMSCGGGEVDRKSRRAESVALGMNLFEEQHEVSVWF